MYICQFDKSELQGAVIDGALVTYDLRVPTMCLWLKWAKSGFFASLLNLLCVSGCVFQ